MSDFLKIIQEAELPEDMKGMTCEQLCRMAEWSKGKSVVTVINAAYLLGMSDAVKQITSKS